MTTTVTESQGITVGTRVRMVDPGHRGYRSVAGQAGTVMAVSAAEADTGTMLQVRYDNGVVSSHYASRVQVIGTVELVPGMRVRIADPAFTSPDGSGFVNGEFYGAEGVIAERYTGYHPDNWWVELPNGNRNHIHESYLTPVGQDEQQDDAPASPLPLEMGARVRTLCSDGVAREGTVMSLPCGGGCCPGTFQEDGATGTRNLNATTVVLPPDPNAPAPESVQLGDVVRYDGQEYRVARLNPYTGTGEGMRYGGSDRGDRRYDMVQIVTTTGTGETDAYLWQVAFIRHDTSPLPAPEPQYGVPVGTRVRSPGYFVGEGVTVEKTLARASARQMRQSDISQVRQPNGLELVVNNRNLMVVPDIDLSALTVEQKLDRLQRMIHRVASYEAVRRSWCDEVNTALSALEGLLPTELLRVDRNLGARLVDRPATLFLLDDGYVPPTAEELAEQDDDEDEHVDCETDCEACYPLVTRTFDVSLSVDYETDAGFSVSGADITVTATTDEWYEDYGPDSYEIRGLVTDEMIRDAIDRADALPDTVTGPYWLSDTSINDWTEV